MEVSAKIKHVNISAQKVRLIADEIRGNDVADALIFLTFCNNGGAPFLKKALESAIANAENNNGADIDELIVSKVFIDEGNTLKRARPRAKGRMDRVLKRSCRIIVVVSDGDDYDDNPDY